VAEKLNRRWIACDLGRFAIHTTRKRLLGIEGVRPFVVQNLGKYERQAWQSAEFQVDDVQSRYREFILSLYHAQPIRGQPGCTASRAVTWSMLAAWIHLSRRGMSLPLSAS
jgi:adenine-specific DNA-methyltransferase